MGVISPEGRVRADEPENDGFHFANREVHLVGISNNPSLPTLASTRSDPHRTRPWGRQSHGRAAVESLISRSGP